MLRFLAALLFLSSSLGSSVHAQAQGVVCFGDSLTFGTGSTPGSAYPDFLEKDLATAGFHIPVVNQGVPSDTTANGIARLPTILALHPSVVVLALGANDAVTAVPVATIDHNLATIIEALQQAKIHVLLAGIALPPGQGPNYVRDHMQAAYLQQFYAVYPSLARRYNIPYIPFLLQGVYGVPGLMSIDYLHPNAAGYEKVALNVLPGVEQLLH